MCWTRSCRDYTPSLPAKFFICLSFNPEKTKGVYVHYDAAADGDSRRGLPGSLNDANQGDWMIRAIVAKKVEGK